jgi:hypothetical protein
MAKGKRMTKAEYTEYLQSAHWRQLREVVIRRYGECVKCRMPRWLVEIVYGQDLHVHHKTYARKGHEDPDDLEPLCARCHELETFGRTELKAPKEAHCEFCMEAHWDYRAHLCEFCQKLFGTDEGIEHWAEQLRRLATEKPNLVAHLRSLARG